RSNLQLPVRLAGGNVFGWIKQREVLADDFIGGVPFEACGSKVPSQYVASGIQCVDGVILDAFDEQAVEPRALERLALLSANVDSSGCLLARGAGMHGRRGLRRFFVFA